MGVYICFRGVVTALLGGYGGCMGVCVFKGGCLLYLYRGSAVHISNSVFFGTDFSLSVCAVCICESTLGSLSLVNIRELGVHLDRW